MTSSFWRKCIPAFRESIGICGLSLMQISIRSGVSKSTIDNWLADRSNPTIDNLYRVCMAIGAPLEVIIGWSVR